MLLFLAALPFIVFWLFLLTTDRAILTFNKVHKWPWEDAAVFVQSAENASDAYLKVLELKGGLHQLERAGQRLWGRNHSWQISDFHPSWKLSDLEGRITNPHFALAWDKQSTDENREAADKVLTAYSYIRIDYSRFKYEIDQLHSQARGAANGLPDDASILRSLDNLNVYFDTTIAMDKIEQAKEDFEVNIAPFFLPDEPESSASVSIVGFVALAIFAIAAIFYFLDRRKRFRKQFVVNQPHPTGSRR